MGGHLFGSWFWRLGHWYGRVKSTSRKSQLIPGAPNNQRGQTQSMLSNVVSGEQLHSGSFCAGWDGEGISRMGAYSDHTGDLPKRGGEASGLSRGHRGNLGQHNSAWGHRNRLLCKHQTWVTEDFVNPRIFDVI